MKIFNVGKEQNIKEDYLDKISEFDSYEIEQIQELGVEVAFYWYATGDYCGGGDLLMLKGNKWYRHNCSHCSCYGPLEDLALTKENRMSKKDLQKADNEMKSLVDYAKERGFLKL